jgi:hypothetical protein
MNNSEQLVGVIKSILGEKAASNTLAIKVAQEIVDHDFEVGQKLAELVFSHQANDQSDNMAYFKHEHEIFEDSVESELEASRTLSYFGK